MIDIVTVVFKDDLHTLPLQAESIGLYCKDLDINKVSVIINDDDSLRDQVDQHWWTHAGKFELIPQFKFAREFPLDGWVTQQASKLIAAMHSPGWCMVLDAKTIFIKNIDSHMLFDECNRARVGTKPIPPVFAKSKEITELLFDIVMVDQLGPGGVPFMFHGPSIKQMIDHIESRLSMPFGEWFCKQGMLTEFLLYSGFIQYRDSTYDKLYSAEVEIIPTNICDTDPEGVDLKLRYMPKSHTVSIHRGIWASMSDIQKTSYRNILLESGITRCKDLY